MEIIEMHKFIKADTEEFGHNANVSSKNNEVLYPNYVFFILDIFLFDPHQDINFIQG